MNYETDDCFVSCFLWVFDFYGAVMFVLPELMEADLLKKKISDLIFLNTLYFISSDLMMNLKVLAVYFPCWKRLMFATL